jgi:hypothetical protein
VSKFCVTQLRYNRKWSFLYFKTEIFQIPSRFILYSWQSVTFLAERLMDKALIKFNNILHSGVISSSTMNTLGASACMLPVSTFTFPITPVEILCYVTINADVMSVDWRIHRQGPMLTKTTAFCVSNKTIVALPRRGFLHWSSCRESLGYRWTRFAENYKRKCIIVKNSLRKDLLILNIFTVQANADTCRTPAYTVYTT